MTFLKYVEGRGVGYIFLSTFLHPGFQHRVDWKGTYRHPWEPLAETSVVPSGRAGGAEAGGGGDVYEPAGSTETHKQPRPSFHYILLHKKTKHPKTSLCEATHSLLGSPAAAAGVAHPLSPCSLSRHHCP